MGRPRKTDRNLPHRLYLKGKAYWYAGKDGWVNLGRDLPAARVKWAELENAAPAPQTLCAVIDRYLREIGPTKAASSQQSDKMSAATLTKVFGHMRPEDLTAADVWEFMQARGKKSQIRANRERSLLQSVMRYAIVWGHVRDNVVREVPSFKELPRTRYVTDEEFQAVKAIASPVVAAVMELARLTGQRRGDLITLRRDAITEEGLVISQSKVARKRPMRLCIEWTPAMRAAVQALLDLPRPFTSLALVTTRDGSPMTLEGWQTIWQRTMTRALETGAITERFHFHDLRAQAYSKLKEEGREARALTGHATDIGDRAYDRRRTKKVFPVE